MKCKFPECNRDALTKGYCGGHYRQIQRGHQILTPLNKNKTKMVTYCLLTGCDAESYCKGYCRRHYHQFKNGQLLTLERKKIPKEKDAICSYENCNYPQYAKGLCQKHYSARRYSPKKSNLTVLKEENQRLKSEIEQLKTKQYLDSNHGYDCLCSFCAKFHPLG
jgi:hypothetical protein